MSKLLVRKITGSGHLKALKRSKHVSATAALEKECHVPIFAMEYKRRKTGIVSSTSCTRRGTGSCFDRLADLFGEAVIVDRQSSFPVIEWTDEARAEVSDDELMSGLRLQPFLRNSNKERERIHCIARRQL